MNLPTNPFIDGEPRASASSDRCEIINPATEEAFADFASGNSDDIDRAVRGAHRAFEQSWRDMTPGRRARILFDIAAIIRANAGELAQLDMRCVGKPIAEARDEVALGARLFEYYAGAVSTFGGQTIPVAGGGLDFTLRQSLGVVAAIVPWNFPFPITCWKLAPALAAGNTVVLKPAQPSPLSALRLAELAMEAGLPAGVLQVVPGEGPAVGEALVRHPLVRKVSFTGSTPVGTRIMEVAAKDIKRVSLELGGKSPNIVFADADLTKAAARGPMSVFANSGQDCCARTRVFVERSVFDKFVERFVAATRDIVMGDPADEKTQIGPLVTRGQRDKVLRFIDGAKQQGRTLALGGDRFSGRGFYISPTIVLDADVTDAVWREEVFGPVVCIRPFDDEATMIREVNDSPYGLSGSIWTRDIGRAIRVARRVESGVLGINTNSSVHVEAPFGGFKQSGIGRDLGMAAMEGYTELKTSMSASNPHASPVALDLATLRHKIDAREIDTVLVVFPDALGRLVGKRMSGGYFLEQCAEEGTHGCNYLLTVNIAMDPVDGFKLASWDQGYGDFWMRPDLSTLRVLPWLTNSALVMCDLHKDTGEPVREAPRTVLREQVDRLAKDGLICNCASELEFFLFNLTYHAAHQANYHKLPPSSDYRIDYHVMQPGRDEPIMRDLRLKMEGAGVPIESTKGEWGKGQHEANFTYNRPLPMADGHMVFKQGAKEIAEQHGKSLSFMPKIYADEAGNSCHIHVSIWRGGESLFWDRAKKEPSQYFRAFLGGLMKYSRELGYFFAPTVNAYKRYQAGSWAPTKMAWAHDNRTTGFRVVGDGGSFRIENRMPGGDANPYLAFSAMIAAGLAGVEETLDCGDAYKGNAYIDDSLIALPPSLKDAAEALHGSAMARKAFGDEVVDFYVHTARAEAKAFDAAVTDWERARYFEQI